MSSDPDVPDGLRTWFVVHFVADFAFALPLLFAPVWFLERFGWTTVDPATARLVGAALVGIGLESLLGRNGSRASMTGMLRLKVAWSSTATMGLLVSWIEGGPTALLLFVAIFAGFCGLWSTWWIRLRRTGQAARKP